MNGPEWHEGKANICPHCAIRVTESDEYPGISMPHLSTKDIRDQILPHLTIQTTPESLYKYRKAPAVIPAPIYPHTHR